jgi:hypothetical protein
MEPSSITVESVRNLPVNSKHCLEDMLGQTLQENQQVFIMVLSPGSEPDEAARRQARAGLETTFAKTAAYAGEHDITDTEIEAALQEATRQVRLPRE